MTEREKQAWRDFINTTPAYYPSTPNHGLIARNLHAAGLPTTVKTLTRAQSRNESENQNQGRNQVEKIAKNPKFNDLRVRVVAEAGTPLVETHSNHPARMVTEEIPPNPDFNGLRARVIAKAGSPLVRTHPHHPERGALDALGTPRHEKADKS
jgi:hypothetical protein